MLIKGRWTENWQPVQGSDRHGRFLRQPSSIRNWITRDGQAGPTGSSGFKAEAGRYHLYVALICPWASRTLAVRALKQLESSISVSVVNPILSAQGWQFGGFPGATADHLHNSSYLHQLYTRQTTEYSGRATVPVLWDKQSDRMVNNESADIMRMLHLAFPGPAGLDLYPQALREEINLLNQRYYLKLSNAVYQAGFAGSQFAYNEAYADVFSALEELEAVLATGPYLFGMQLTETDIRLFVTLIRFDLVYFSLFKCNQRQLANYPHLSRYLARLYAIPELRSTVNSAHIKQGYYSIRALNPSGIVPQGPALDLLDQAS